MSEAETSQHQKEAETSKFQTEAETSKLQTEAETSKLQALEAILFAAGDPVSKTQLAEVLEIEPTEVDLLLAELEKRYASPDHGIEVRLIGEQAALATKAETSPTLEKFFAKPPKQVHLSQAAYETLAVVAYNEPVTRAQIEQVRGVNSDAALNRLVEKGLVEMSGVLEMPGRPGVFKTTDLFLRLYGIRDVGDLEPMDMLMYGTVQDFEQSYRLTQELARKEEAVVGSESESESESEDEYEDASEDKFTEAEFVEADNADAAGGADAVDEGNI